jgi:hypothetical protein
LLLQHLAMILYSCKLLVHLWIDTIWWHRVCSLIIIVKQEGVLTTVEFCFFETNSWDFCTWNWQVSVGQISEGPGVGFRKVTWAVQSPARKLDVSLKMWIVMLKTFPWFFPQIIVPSRHTTQVHTPLNIVFLEWSGSKLDRYPSYQSSCYTALLSACIYHMPN